MPEEKKSELKEKINYIQAKINQLKNSKRLKINGIVYDILHATLDVDCDFSIKKGVPLVKFSKPFASFYVLDNRVENVDYARAMLFHTHELNLYLDKNKICLVEAAGLNKKKIKINLEEISLVA